MPRITLCDNCVPTDVIETARKWGAGVELQSFFEPSVIDDANEALSEHRAALDGFNNPRSLHGPFADLCPGSVDPALRDVAKRRYLQAFDVMSNLDAAEVVVHHGYVPNTSAPDNWVRRSVAFWKDVLACAPEHVRAIHLENMLERTPDLLIRVIDGVADKRLDVCLDIGHAHAFSKLPVTDWIEACGGRIGYAHLHDNGGEADEHLPLGDGTIPLSDVFERLMERAPDATWAIETDARPSMQWLVNNGFLER